MSEASFASLNPSLLARKGGAKPAMRPQFTNLPAAEDPQNLEDLGWNDMGQEDDAPQGAEVVQLNPATANDTDAEAPEVRKQQKKLAAKMADEALAAAAPAKSPKAKPAKSKAKPASDSGRRAAFTLRLDTDRHLKLRLAATMQGKSAQAVVTEALDVLLDQIDDLDALAKQMQRD